MVPDTKAEKNRLPEGESSEVRDQEESGREGAGGAVLDRSGALLVRKIGDARARRQRGDDIGDGFREERRIPDVRISLPRQRADAVDDGVLRARIALVYVIEYGVLGAATGVLALLAGTLAAWIIAKTILEVPFTFDAQAVIVTVAGGGAATLLFGLLGGLGALSVRPARRLRST